MIIIEAFHGLNATMVPKLEKLVVGNDESSKSHSNAEQAARWAAQVAEAEAVPKAVPKAVQRTIIFFILWRD